MLEVQHISFSWGRKLLLDDVSFSVAPGETVVLHNRQMTLYFVQNTDSPFYRSAAFTRIIEFAAAFPLRCKLDESKGRRRMTITQVPNAEAALITMQRLVKGE